MIKIGIYNIKIIFSIVNHIKELNVGKPPKKNVKHKIWNVIFPNFIMAEYNPMYKYLLAVEEMLKTRMSYDYIFKHLIQYERLKRILLSEEQTVLIDNLPKIKLEEITDYSSLNKNELARNIQLIYVDKKDRVNEKLKKIFK